MKNIKRIVVLAVVGFLAGVILAIFFSQLTGSSILLTLAISVTIGTILGAVIGSLSEKGILFLP
jgi:hypothetical protein